MQDRDEPTDDTLTVRLAWPVQDEASQPADRSAADSVHESAPRQGARERVAAAEQPRWWPDRTDGAPGETAGGASARDVIAALTARLDELAARIDKLEAALDERVTVAVRDALERQVPAAAPPRRRSKRTAAPARGSTRV